MIARKLYVTALIACSLSLAGCEIYFGDEHRGGGGDGGSYTYCDSTGCYTCDDSGCYGGQVGGACDSNSDCEAGCYCDADGYCEEAGFCSTDADCPDGMVCDERDSCVLDGSITCTMDSDCATGSYCDDSGTCVATGTCSADNQCGDGFDCDVERATCVPQAPKLCQAPVTCNSAPPTCDQGTNPGIADGCYTGECVADADCSDGAPVTCADHGNEPDCLADAACDPIYKGLNCTKPDGGSCTSGSANCTCESFIFDECVAHAP